MYQKQHGKKISRIINQKIWDSVLLICSKHIDICKNKGKQCQSRKQLVPNVLHFAQGFMKQVIHVTGENMKQKTHIPICGSVRKWKTWGICEKMRTFWGKKIPRNY